MSPSAIDSLFATTDPPDLGPQARPGTRTVEEAEAAATRVLAAVKISESNAACLKALVLLWHDHFDEAHRIVQDLPGGDAAFVHGILHRREPDYSNARYWFHRIGKHATLEPLAEATAPILAAHAALPYRLIRDGVWDPFAYIDAVSVASRQPQTAPEVGLLRELQRQEAIVLGRYLARG